MSDTIDIPIAAGKRIADEYGYDQVVIVARKVGDGGREHVTTYGIDQAHCAVAARMGNFFKHKLMGWPAPTAEDAGLADWQVPFGLHPETVKLVTSFAGALAAKLRHAERKHGYSDEWRRRENIEGMRADLAAHFAKGDPRDVAAYCAFLWWHHERTVAQASPVDDSENSVQPKAPQ